MDSIKPVTNFSLRSLNTFGLEVTCAEYFHITEVQQLVSLVQKGLFERGRTLLLGGGSNLLFVHDFFDGSVVHLDLKGREIHLLNEDYAILTVAAGENWHQTVLYALSHNLGGIENLSLIPGNAGTAPVQNIGAYGVEICEVLEYVDGIDLTTGYLRRLSAAECRFAYRDSVFKGELKDTFAITNIAMRLTRINHVIRSHYSALSEKLRNAGIVHPTIQDISRAVISIRQSKLPDPNVLGNCGSFFKNPVVSSEVANGLIQRFGDIPTFPTPDGVKIPAGWLIERAGWKGKRLGNVGMHERQALVLVNYGGASGYELWNHAQRVMADIREKFGIALQPEVNIIF